MNPATDDPGSLNRLHDIVIIPPAPWWPPTLGWLVQGLLLAIIISLLLTWWTARWRQNWYRRAGLVELQQIERATSESLSLLTLAELVKRVALAAYPRDQVAGLTGDAWLRFLDQTGGMTAFSSGPGRALTQVYDRVPSSPTPELYELVRQWIQQHRSDKPC